MCSKPNQKAAVIDVGSNSIKLLVASIGTNEPLNLDLFLIKETRIGEGTTGTPPALDESAIERGSQAIIELVEDAKKGKPDHIAIVATSAVRDAVNRDLLIDAVESKTGIRLRVLSGDEEARYIGKGIQCDPRLNTLSNFTLLDLGGGSLECIRFKDGNLESANSLQLGAVRLTNLLEVDRQHPLPLEKQEKITNHVIASFEQASLISSGTPSNIAILTGGASAIVSKRYGKKTLSIETIEEYGRLVSQYDAAQRVTDLGVPESRSDIFPAAITTIIAMLKHLGCDTVHFSGYNLRYGIAQSLLKTGSF